MIQFVKRHIFIGSPNIICNFVGLALIFLGDMLLKRKTALKVKGQRSKKISGAPALSMFSLSIKNERATSHGLGAIVRTNERTDGQTDTG